MKRLFANREPDQMPCFAASDRVLHCCAASDLVLHCLPMSHKKDARLIWVKAIITTFRYLLMIHTILQPLI